MGHLGTLDPFASGLVIVALGRAVRYSEYALGCRKTYRARLYLGEETDTLDPTGKVIKSAAIPPDWRSNLNDVGEKFTGEIEQVPPSFSAKQVDGVRSYEAARKGEELELKPSAVTIYRLEFAEPSELWVDFTCEVSAGTYIRALGRDIARALGTVGHLVGLERLSVGPFPLEEGIPFSAFEYGGARVVWHHLRPVDQILADLPECVVKPGLSAKLTHGQLLSPDDIIGDFPDADESITLRIVDTEGKFRALGRVRKNPPGIVPFKPWLVGREED
jgi:tRNA pseudouridine55 synthase